MSNIIFKYISYKDDLFEQVISFRYKILFEPYHIIGKYRYDELDKDSFHLIALEDNKVVAYSRLTKVNRRGKITNVSVFDSHVGKGMGHKMLKIHIGKAEELGITEVFLDSRMDTIGFYEKFGFLCSDNTMISLRSGLKLQTMYYKVF